MLNKNPKQRITIPEIKKHPFFAILDWNKLMRREITPPVILSMDDDDDRLDEPNEEAMFLKHFVDGNAPREIFKDKDYEKNNRTLNRVKQYTFAERKT